MAVIQGTNITKYFGSEMLFKNLNFTINEKDHVALVGENGCGKTTLIKIILGKEAISSNPYNESMGNVSIPKNIVIGYLSQNVINDFNHTLLEEALTVFGKQIECEKELEELTKTMANHPQDDKLQDIYAKKLNSFEAIGGYDYHYLIEMILLKFGFSKDDFNRQINSFSGGEKTKMAFAKLLLLKPDVLILDEPTNHLDLSTIDWLENYLKTYSGTILFVSHDRYFIDSVANRIFELENKELTIYRGNYSQYLNEKKLHYELMLKNYNKQQKEIEKLKRFIEYFKPKPRFVARAKDREKKLEHMKIIDKPKDVKKSISISFKSDVLKGKKIFELSEAEFGYDKTPLFSPITFTMYSDDHLAIMGNNGTGKTTIIKTILSQVPLLSGNLTFLRPLNIGYLAQNDFDLDNLEDTLVEYLQNYFSNLSEKDARNHLGKFGFFGDDVFKKVKVLSGGEKKCLVLSRLVLNNYDLLVLDEPTNHLDLLTKETLINALENYQGALIVVSHDRYFVDTLCNKIIYLYRNKPFIHTGSYLELKGLLSELIEEEQVKKSIRNKIKKNEPKLSKSKCEEKIRNLETIISKLKEAQFQEENYMDANKMKEIDAKIINAQEEYDKLLEYYFNEFSD